MLYAAFYFCGSKVAGNRVTGLTLSLATFKLKEKKKSSLVKQSPEANFLSTY